MGHITKRTRGGKVRWVARYRAPDGRERTKTFDRRVDAQLWLTEQTSDLARGAWADPTLGKISFGEWAARWQTGLVGLRPTTVELNVGVLRSRLLPRFGPVPLAKITTSDVKAMVADDVAAGRSSSATRRGVIVLRSILQAAVAEGRLARNPAVGVPLPAETSRPMRFLTPAQVVEVAEAHPAHYRPLVYTAAYVGLRLGELAGLRLERVDLLRRTIAVVEQLVEVGGKLQWGPPKTKSGTRTVTIPAALVEILGEHFATEPVQGSGLAFPTPRGKPMHRTNFRTVWRRALEQVGWTGDHPLAGIVFHELRHTAASLAIAQGAHPLVVKERLGHSSIAVTMDTYGHLMPAQDEALAEALDGVLRDSLADRMRTPTDPVVRLRRSQR